MMLCLMSVVQMMLCCDECVQMMLCCDEYGADDAML